MPTKDIVIKQPDSTGELYQLFDVLIAASEEMEVTNREEHAAGQLLFGRLAKLERGFIEHHKEPKMTAHAAHRSICAAEKKVLDPVRKAKTNVSKKCTAYLTEARMKAEREARERQAAIDREMEERQLQDAIDAESSGDKELADAILDEPVTAPVVQPEPELAKVQGVTTQTRWTFEVDDKAAFVKHCLDRGCLELLQVDRVAVGRIITSVKEHHGMPGIRAIAKTTMVGRGK